MTSIETLKGSATDKFISPSSPIQKLWPASHPERLQLYSADTPNGVKVSIMLEEIGVPYETHKINLSEHESHAPEFLALNPNGKIPAILDPNPGGKPTQLYESIAILIYLADKSGKLLARDGNARYSAIQWAIWQVGSVGPNFGNLGYFSRFGGKDIEDKRPLQRFVTESQKLMKVLDDQLTETSWVAGDEFTIADVSMIGWVRNMVYQYEAGGLIGFHNCKKVQDWLKRCLDRPAVQAGLSAYLTDK